MLIGVPHETAAGETRVAATPETVKKLKAQGHTVRVQAGAGLVLDSIAESEFQETITKASATLKAVVAANHLVSIND